MIYRGTDDGEAERDIDRVTKPQGFQHRQPLVMKHGQIGIGFSSSLSVNAVSAERGLTPQCPVLASARHAGVITSRSSWPKCPPSPAWGLRPSTVIRGCSMPNCCESAWFTTASVCSMRGWLMASGTSRSGRWVVASATLRSPRPAASPHHSREKRPQDIPYGR